MIDKGYTRKLTAILSADVEGYSRLMGEDEDATIKTLTTYRELMTTLIHKHRGRVVDSPGDNLLSEFFNKKNSSRLFCGVAHCGGCWGLFCRDPGGNYNSPQFLIAKPKA